MRLMIAVSLLLFAAQPALAQAKLWEQNKVLTCTATMAHSCTEQACQSQAISEQFRLDLAAKSACIVRGPACEEPEKIGMTKVIEGAFFAYVGDDKADPTIFRIWDDGRFSAVGLRKISEEGGGFTILGTCAAP